MIVGSNVILSSSTIGNPRLQFITGHILGALNSVEVIPQRWLDRFDLADLIDAVAPDLYPACHEPDAFDEMGTFDSDRCPGI
jgi:hypothetical protein